jgi:hypothetical protein
VTLAIFGRLLEIKPVAKTYEGVNRLESLLGTEFKFKWEELRKLRRSSQQGLFEAGESGELNLTKS